MQCMCEGRWRDSMCERRERERMSFVSHRCGCCVLECCICCTHVPALLAAGNVQLSLLTYLQVYVA